MNLNLDFKWTTWIGLIATPILIAGGQVLFKLASRETGDFNLAGVFSLLFNPWLISALALYGFGTIVWIFVLKLVPLTIAYSFMALTFCAVPIMAHFWLGEPVSWKYAIGAALIVGGMVIINLQRPLA